MAYVDLISAEMLRNYMDARKQSTRSIAAQLAERDIYVAPSTIGHLLTGRNVRTSVERAQAIEDVLLAPRGGLFDMSHLSSVQPVTASVPA